MKKFGTAFVGANQHCRHHGTFHWSTSWSMHRPSSKSWSSRRA